MVNSALSQTAAVNVANNKQLFIDYKFVDQSDNIKLTVNPPVKMGPVISSENLWEAGGLGYNNVLDDQGQFKMWYLGWSQSEKSQYGKIHVCYAVSTDGINWTKPRLGIVEFGGSRENNILPCEIEDSGTVFVDPLASSNSRYKMVAMRNWGKEDAGIYLYESSDGIHFSLLPTRLFDLWPDTQNQIFYDTRIKKYVAYLRSWKNRSDKPYGEGAPLPLRTVGRLEIDNLIQPWQYNKLSNPYKLWGNGNIPAITEEMQEVMACDEQDPPESDLYTPSVVQYQLAADVYFAFPSLYRHFPPPPEGKYSNDGMVDIQMAVSRDGINWTRFRTPYVALGLEENGDSKTMYMGIGMFKKGNEIYQYYIGTTNTHGEDVGKNAPKDQSHIFRVVQRLDGFVSVDADYTGGFIITPSLVFQGNSLELNINTSAAGHARVEILDESGIPIPGYTLKDSDLIQGNYVSKKVLWRGKSDVSSLAGKPVRIKMVMRAAKLFAFKFD